MGLPLDYRSEFLGRAKMLNESNGNFLLAFLASFLFMYMGSSAASPTLPGLSTARRNRSIG